MNIALVTGFTENYRKIGELARKNKGAYCHHHGYEYIEEHTFDPQRPPSWSKVLFVLKHLRSFDWIFWSDADSLIIDQTKPLEVFLKNISLGEFLVISAGGKHKGTPHGYNGLNFGHFFIKDTWIAYKFLVDVWLHTRSLPSIVYEQHAVQAILKNYHGNYKFVSECEFNTPLSTPILDPFIMHFAGIRNVNTIEKMMIEWLPHVKE